MTFVLAFKLFQTYILPINNVILHQKDPAKFVGVLFDSDLDRKKHIDSLCTKLAHDVT